MTNRKLVLILALPGIAVLALALAVTRAGGSLGSFFWQCAGRSWRLAGPLS